MRAVASRASCALGALGGAWVIVSLAHPSGVIALPLRAILFCACVSALVGAAGVALRRGPLPLLLLLIGFAIPMANTRAIESQDTAAAAAIPFALLRDHSLTLPGPRESWLVPLDDGRFASRYPVATALLGLPFELPAAAGSGAVTPEMRNVGQKLAASGLVGCMLALLFLAQRRLVGPRAAAVASALTLLATPATPILGQALWQHTGAALALSAALAALILPERAGRSALVGFCAGVAIACRPPDLPLAIAVALLERRRLVAAAGAAVPVALTFLYQRVVFGDFLRTGYGPEAIEGWRPSWPDGAEGFLGVWLSPGRGLLVVYPILLFAMIALLRSRELRLLGLSVLAESLLIGCWFAWEGGWCPGPRMLADAVPIFGLGISLAVKALPGWPRALRGAFLAAAGLSVAAATVMAFVVPSGETKALLYQMREGRWSAQAWPLFAYARGQRR